jgi:hypothetical protein
LIAPDLQQIFERMAATPLLDQDRGASVDW